MSVDGYMNISLEKTEEYVDGKLRRSYGEAFVRGNNGSFLFLDRRSIPLMARQCCISPLHELTLQFHLRFYHDMARGYRLLAVEHLVRF